MRRSTSLLVAAIAVLLYACRRDSDPVPPEPVAECVAYEKAVVGCFHSEQPIANQPSLVPKTYEERVQIAQLCRENLARIKIACR